MNALKDKRLLSHLIWILTIWFAISQMNRSTKLFKYVI